MKAVRCRQYGSLSDLQIEDVDTPEVGDGDLLLKVLAAGVNFPDGLLVLGLYQSKPDLPFTPGMELCGEIVSMGAGVTDFSAGERVICSSDGYGGYAEYVAVPSTVAVSVGTDMPAELACNLLIAHGTAHHALVQRAALLAGETLVVLGAAGGTGLAAVQIGKALGATVIAAASTDEKLGLAESHGADHLINYSTVNLKDAIRAHTGGGADVIYDPVGGDAFDAAVRAVARHGRYLVIGFASGRIPSLPANLALVKEFSLIGVYWGNFIKQESESFAANMRQLFQWYDEGKVSVVLERTYSLAQTSEALQHVMTRQVQGKVAILPTQTKTKAG